MATTAAPLLPRKQAMNGTVEACAIFVADDEIVVRNVVKQTLEQQGHTVTCFTNASDCLDLLQCHGQSCDLLIVGAAMADMSGIDLVRTARRIRSALPIVVVARHGDIPLAVAAIKAGATDFVEQPLEDDVLLPIVNAALKTRYSGDCLADGVLTATELKILKMVIDDKTTKEIAYSVGCSNRTIETHRYRIMQKLNVESTNGLVKAALAMGLVSP